MKYSFLNKFRTTALLTLFTFFISMPVFSAQLIPSFEISDIITIPPATSAYIPLTIIIPAKGYIYGNPKGPGIGKPLSVEVSSSKGILAKTVLVSPTVRYYPSEEGYVNIYRKKAIIFIPVTTDKSFHQSKISVNISGLMCTDSACVPFNIKQVLIVKNGPSSVLSAPPSDAAPIGTISSISKKMLNRQIMVQSASEKMAVFHPQFLSHDITGIIPAILLGLLAGLFLNLMPCVLPILSLKIMSIVRHARSKSSSKISGLAYTAGILTSFTILAFLAAFAGWGWGSLFQNTNFIIIIVLLLFMFSLSLFGVYDLNVPGFAGRAAAYSFHSMTYDSFVKGALAAILATPCSGPLLGAALAWSLTMPWYIILAVFLSIGIGLATPYLAVSLIPSLVSFIPKPGPWMLTFERFMGFLLAGSVIYFMSILESSYFIPVSIMLFIAALGLWQYGKWGNKSQSQRMQIISTSILIIFIASAMYIPLTHTSAETIIENVFHPAAVTQASKKGNISVIYFTADWCPNCKLAEKTALETDAVKKLFLDYKVVLFKADITQPGTEAEDLLKELGGSAIPFIAVFPAGENFSKPVCIRDLYTKDDIKKALVMASKK